MATSEDEASTLAAVARALDASVTSDIERSAALTCLRAIGATIRTVESARHRIVNTLQGRPRSSPDHASWPVIADALGEPQSTVYGRWEREVRRGVGPAPVTEGDTLAHAIDALTGTTVADDAPSTALLLDAAQASFARRRRNSVDGAAVLGALAERMSFEDIEARTGIPVDVAQGWADPPGRQRP